MSFDKELLFKNRLDEGEVEIPGLGTIRVRGLARGEVYAIQQAKGLEAMERKILTFGVIDPELTEAEVGKWQASSPAGELEPVVEKIRELSGLNEGADKSSLPSVGDES